MKFKASGQRSDEKVRSRTDGLFHDGSVLRKVGREALGLLGGGRAVLMQVAHPLVAAGVADHSAFRQDPLTRLMRTLDLIHVLIHGDGDEVDAALYRFQAVHASVTGSLHAETGPFQAGTRYSALDPSLKLWVHATLIDTGLETYERFVRPLADEERDSYYADTLVLGETLGIAKDLLPRTLDDFRAYVKDMLDSDTLTVSDEARDIAQAVLRPRGVGILPGSSARLLRFTTAGLLPERLREQYRMVWKRRHQLVLDAMSRTTRTVRPVSPRWVWQSPKLGGSLSGVLVWGPLGPRR